MTDLTPAGPKRRGRPKGSKNKNRRPVDDLAPRTCIACTRTMAPRMFPVGPTNHTTGEAYRRRTCADCSERKRRAAGIPVRHERYNLRGEVWCNNCQKYRSPDEFKRHPYRTHTYWAYCKPCTRIMDRMRYRAKASTPAGREEIRRSRKERKDRQRRGEHASRRHFVKDAIQLLRRRSLSKAEICRLARVSFGSLIRWEQGGCLPTPQVAERLAILVRETGYLKAAKEPVSGSRWTPHPDLLLIEARCAPLIEAIPVRSAWVNGKRGTRA